MNLSSKRFILSAHRRGRLIRSKMGTKIEMGLFRMSAPDFDKRALREAIVNAYSHRDYSRMGRIRVSIADEGVTVKNLLTAEPHGKNPALADALKRIGLAEKPEEGADVVQLLHVNENKSYRLLHKLVKDNEIVPVNRGLYAKYQLKRS